MSAVPALRKGREERGTLDRGKTKQAEGQATPPGCSRCSKSESTGLPIILAHRLRDLEIENADTENISSRKRSRFPPFEKRKGWGTLSCDDIGTERMGHPPDTERDCGTIPGHNP
jgi:hypothetical protein